MRGAKLWVGAMNGDTQTHFLSEMIAVHPRHAEIYSFAYMGRTEIAPDIRKAGDSMATRDAGYVDSDSGKSRAWLVASAEFARPPRGEAEGLLAQSQSMRQSNESTQCATHRPDDFQHIADITGKPIANCDIRSGETKSIHDVRAM